MSPAKARARAVARHLSLDVLSQVDRVRRDAALERPRVHNLYLHDVPQHEEGTFRDLIAWLISSGHELISYSEGIRRTAHGDIDRPYVTFSFDDGYASNVRAGQILADNGASACFFLTTQLIGATDINEARRVMGPGVPEPGMSWGDIELLRSMGHEVGNHTRTHRNLAKLPRGQAEVEILGAKDELIARLGGVEHFAWPLGRWFHFSQEAREIAEGAHASVASAERGSHGPMSASGLNTWCPRRDHVMTSWPLRHIQHFVTASARRSASAAGWGDLK